MHKGSIDVATCITIFSGSHQHWSAGINYKRKDVWLASILSITLAEAEKIEHLIPFSCGCL